MKDYTGKIIRELRIRKGITQSALADNICSVKQLSRIENQESNPTTFILSEIALKLGYELFDYFPYVTESNVYELKNAIEQAMNLFELGSHKACFDYIENSHVLNNTESIRANQEVAWLRGALSNYIEVPIEVTKAYYLQILKLSRTFNDIIEIFKNPISPLEFRIINSLIVLHLKDLNFEYAEQLLTLSIANYEKNHTKIGDSSYTRFLYNLSRLYMNQKKLESAKITSFKGIKYCISSNSIAYYSDLCNIYGRSCYKLGETEEGQEYIKTYIQLSKTVYPSLNNDQIIKTLIKRYNL